jgi:hypothetical protein
MEAMLRRERRGLSAIACVLALGCGGQHESAREPSQDRCVVRISERGTFVDGERMSRADAVAHCKRAPGGAVLASEYPNAAIESELEQTKSALDREGVRVYRQGAICYEPGREGCRPRAPAPVIHTVQPRRELVAP